MEKRNISNPPPMAELRGCFRTCGNHDSSLSDLAIMRSFVADNAEAREWLEKNKRLYTGIVQVKRK